MSSFSRSAVASPTGHFFDTTKVRGFSLNDVKTRRVPAVRPSTLQGYLDQHTIATTKRAIAELVAGALTNDSDH